jgi:hypothetical protein
LSGFNGSPHNWSDIRQEKLTWAWARTKHIKIGNPDDESAVCTLTLDACRLSSIEHEIAFCDSRPTERDSGRRGNYAHVAI